MRREEAVPARTGSAAAHLQANRGRVGFPYSAAQGHGGGMTMTFPLIRFALGLALLMGTVIPGLQAAGNLRELVSPAGADSGEANLHADRDGRLHLTWCGPADRADSRAVWLSLLEPSAQTWSSPRAIVVSPRLMENWADFPSLIRGTDGTLWAQWFERRDASVGTGYDGWVARSVDDGRTWSQPSPLGHEFVSLAPMSSGRVLAIWLESLQPPRPAGAPRSPRPTWKPGEATPASMQLKSRLLAADGSTVREWVVDPDVCSCCQTSLVALPGDETLAFYRGRTPLEIRDHCCARFGNETWSAPQPVHEDGWQIAACPVNGPAGDAQGQTVCVAWFTLANGQAKVQAKLSHDGGATFGAPLPIDLGQPLGRVEVVTLADRTSVVLWLESKREGQATGLYARRIFRDGSLSAAELLADVSAARAGGFPRAAVRSSGTVVLAWTEVGPGDPAETHVRVREWDPTQLSPAAGLLPALPRSAAPTTRELCPPTPAPKA